MSNLSPPPHCWRPPSTIPLRHPPTTEHSTLPTTSHLNTSIPQAPLETLSNPNPNLFNSVPHSPNPTTIIEFQTQPLKVELVSAIPTMSNSISTNYQQPWWFKKKKEKPFWPFALPTVVAASPEIQLANRLTGDLARQLPRWPCPSTAPPPTLSADNHHWYPSLSLSLVHHWLFMAVLGLEGLLG